MIVTISKSLQTELYRKAVHLSSLWMPLFILMMNRNVSILLFLSLLLANLAVEYAAYRKVPVIGGWFRRLFFKTLRRKEVVVHKFTPSGSIYVLLAALILSICFVPAAAAAALAVMLVSDTAAALVGKIFGTIRFANGKSVEGTLAFFVSACLILSACALQCPWPVLGIIALLATLAEFFENELQVDDNLSISLVVGFCLNLFYL